MLEHKTKHRFNLSVVFKYKLVPYSSIVKHIGCVINSISDAYNINENVQQNRSYDNEMAKCFFCDIEYSST